MKKLSLLICLILCACSQEDDTDRAIRLCGLQDKNTVVLTWVKESQDACGLHCFWKLKRMECQ